MALGGPRTSVVTTGTGPDKGLLGGGNPVEGDKGNVITQEFIKFTPESPPASLTFVPGKNMMLGIKIKFPSGFTMETTRKQTSLGGPLSSLPVLPTHSGPITERHKQARQRTPPRKDHSPSHGGGPAMADSASHHHQPPHSC